MALNDGYVRFEGSAYFGYDIEGEGYEVVVIVGTQSIEIHDFNGNVLSVWAPGSYRSNGQEPPMLAYFSGDEWLAPQDPELRETLDRFITYDPTPEPAPQPSLLSRIIIPLLVVGAMLLFAFYLINFLALRLLDDSIRRDFDSAIVAEISATHRYCNEEKAKQSREYIASIGTFPEFDIYPEQDQPIALMPSGKIVLDAEFVRALGSEQGVVAALQIAQAQSNQLDIGEEIIKQSKTGQKIRFLSNANMDTSTLLTGWQSANSEADFGPALLRDIAEPIGDYTAITTSLAGWGGQTIEADPVDVALSDQEWLQMISLCEKEN